ncbi:MAG: hypothetical protein SGJ27_09940 [Candidatus Melainabacteria bacterium]|nr:hypothetical protein [Candidatus Melainabacteria bacterium]
MTNSIGQTEGAILTVLVVVVVICCLLYFGRMQEKKDLAAKSDSPANKPNHGKPWTLRSGFGDRPTDDHFDQSEPANGKTSDATVKSTASNGDDWTANEMPVHQRPGWQQAVRDVKKLIVDCQRQLNTHQHAELKDTSTRALQICMTRLSPDHSLTGVCLDWLSYAEQCLGSHYDALLHLESAAMILSEWPSYDKHRRNNMLPRIATCRQMLGFDQEG